MFPSARFLVKNRHESTKRTFPYSALSETLCGAGSASAESLCAGSTCLHCTYPRTAVYSVDRHIQWRFWPCAVGHQCPPAMVAHTVQALSNHALAARLRPRERAPRAPNLGRLRLSCCASCGPPARWAGCSVTTAPRSPPRTSVSFGGSCCSPLGPGCFCRLLALCTSSWRPWLCASSWSRCAELTR